MTKKIPCYSYAVKTMKHIVQRTIPLLPGCYLMKDSQGMVLYVGKAKNLRNRVGSYWHARDEKTMSLVSQIGDIETIVTNTEVEALLLEAQLIQQYHPKYNIDLQTTGRYAFLKITDEEYPRIIIARKIESAGRRRGTYIGPFPSAAARNAALKQAFRIFKLCSASAKATARRGCFRYHLGQCSGACAKLITREDHLFAIKQAEKFLKGNFEDVIKEVRTEMLGASRRQEFERATLLRDQLLALEKIEEQHVSHPKAYDQDVVNYIVQNSTLTLQLFHFHRGIIAGRKEFTFALDTLNVQNGSDALGEFLTQYYGGNAIPREIIVPEAIPDKTVTEEYLSKRAGHAVTLHVPEKGLKKKLLEMVKKNLLAHLGASGGQLYGLQQALHLDSLPKIMVCIDISHLSGTQTVGSLVQFTHGLPAKSGYRKFIIKTVTGINDVAAIEEVMTRYGKRIMEGKEKKPDLVVLDGGRGQLNGAMKALRMLNLSLPTIGLAKRLEEIYVSWAQIPLRLHPKNPGLQVLCALRDEAHRFAITFQRKRRSQR